MFGIVNDTKAIVGYDVTMCFTDGMAVIENFSFDAVSISFFPYAAFPETPSLSLKYKHGCLTSLWEWIIFEFELRGSVGRGNLIHWK